ncbi:hypothetical protein Sjap_017080 [Stephania japonica]|uniref:TF-B3 domain-containing protein n=1 Tax=Stephania japonica TaxID=461633 RepID=A0AAP0I5L2_9MAGN
MAVGKTAITSPSYEQATDLHFFKVMFGDFRRRMINPLSNQVMERIHFLFATLREREREREYVNIKRYGDTYAVRRKGNACGLGRFQKIDTSVKQPTGTSRNYGNEIRGHLVVIFQQLLSLCTLEVSLSPVPSLSLSANKLNPHTLPLTAAALFVAVTVTVAERAFFAIFMLNLYTDRTTQIPRVFIRHLLEESPDEVNLEGPSGSIWRVKLKITKDDVFLEQGWEAFKVDHSLSMGEALLFEYDGKKHMKVTDIVAMHGLTREDVFTVKCAQGSMSQGNERQVSNLTDMGDRQLDNVIEPNLSMAVDHIDPLRDQVTASTFSVRKRTPSLCAKKNLPVQSRGDQMECESPSEVDI